MEVGGVGVGVGGSGIGIGIGKMADPWFVFFEVPGEGVEGVGLWVVDDVGGGAVVLVDVDGGGCVGVFEVFGDVVVGGGGFAVGVDCF